ncbi:SusC/RagA family TonB-linked outer membrane protein [Flavobacterium haoranii]|uniref:Iron complex outermembrane recepter protein n=1 Tax=Flavobacterium haoranii TaxID=683124 RepID=A0A1M6CXZ0_9FLAO|nr:SusC/RagA family TonB-linked outer membrane protein [Flavobacterium haoranii]SHI65849.1 iron complex outermembrane recepter protein [Flavobacterium haoranii]
MKTLQKKLLLLLLILPISMFAQNTLNGVVLDSGSQQPLPGVNIVIKGTSNGTTTDFDGNFSLEKVKQNDVIVFSYLGYKENTVTYTGQKNISVSLTEDSQQLQDVVVIGYGTVKKEDATGSVNTITDKTFVKGPVVAADQMIQGKVAGVQITNGGGAPGEGATIRVRQGSSLGSFGSSNDPLFVIDGVPVAADNTGGRNPLATINQNDIESVTVLKDASAAAIYGSRASNGVIIITTKKGKSGEMKINYNGNVSFSSIAKKVDVLNGNQLRDYVTTYGNANQQALLGTANTDWQKEIYRDAIGTDHNISLSGGADNITYRASAGYTNMDGILKEDNFSRATTSVALVGNFFDNHLKIEANNKTSSMQNNYSERSAIGASLAFDPTQNVTNPDGSYFEWNQQLASRNPVGLINKSHNYGTSFRSLGNIQTEYKLHFFPDLKAVANFGYDYTSGRSYGGYDNDYVYNNVNAEYDYRNESKNRLMDLFLNYKKDISAIKGSIDLTAGYNYQNFDYINNPGFSTTLAGNTSTSQYKKQGYNIQSYFARGIFNVYDKYILTATIRRDGTSRFAPAYRWSNFPSAALAWKLDKEKFLENVNSISSLKLRFGWGITGQQDIGRLYPSLPTYLSADNQAQYQIGNSFYNPIRPQEYNPNLKWEQTETRNIGLDFGLFKNRITGAVDVYEKRTKDLIAYIPNPPFYGFSNYNYYNIGKTKNQGIEMALEAILVTNDDWNVTVGGNVTLQNAKVTGLIDGASEFGISTGGITGGINNEVQRIQVGYFPNAYYVYEQAYDADGNPIDGVFIDRNGDGQINSADRYFYKKPQADVYYGFYTNISYKNWDFAMSWRGSWGNYNYYNVDSNLGWQNQILIRDTDLGNATTEVLNTNFTYAGSERFLSDYYVRDASFIRMDNVTIGYNFKNFLGSKANAKLSLGGQNLILITSYKGIDPEVNGGIDNTIYPRPRMYTLGLNVNF